MEQQGVLAVVVRHCRNAPTKVAEEFETSVNIIIIIIIIIII